jgi:hypothetical protein
MPVLTSSPRAGVGGVIAILVGLSLMGVGTVASAAPADQAAPATPTAAPTCVAAPQGIVIVLGNPSPGDTLFSNQPINISGIAYDTHATAGSGISSVSLYLNDRNEGGTSLGIALLGMPSPQAGPGSQFANSGFTLRTPNLPAGSGSRTIFVYARSSITNAEGVLQVPIYLNASPTPVKGQVPTPVVAPLPSCTPVPAPTATTVPVPTSVPVAAVVPAAPVAPATVAATPTPFPTLPPLPAAAPPAAVPAAPAAVAKPQAAAPAAVAPTAAQTTAPRGGGIPSELGVGLLAVGALVMASGIALRRRQRRAAPADGANTASAL